MLIFTYGTLRRNELYHEILKDAEFIGLGITVDAYFKDDIKDGYGTVMFPYILEHSNTHNVSKIEGEVYKLNPLILNSVDRFEDGYHRKKIKVVTDFGVKYCWCYFLDKKILNNFS